MASNELEVLDPAATVEKLKKLASGRALNRRHFMATLGMTGAAAMSGCSSSTSVTPISNGIAQTDVLNFALNLEYLEATFYSYITQGVDLPATYTVATTVNASNPATLPPAPGNAAVSYPGVTTGSGMITNFPSQIAFPQQITDLLNEIYYDEISHVVALRNLLGPAAVARPALNLGASSFGVVTTAAQALGLARQFEDVGITAYTGASSILSNSNLLFAAQILGVEGFHSGALRLISIQQATPYYQADSYDVAPHDPGSAVAAEQGPGSSGGFFTTAYATPSSMGHSLASPSVPPGFVFSRTTSQVLAILYGNSASGTSKGGFFPSGVNGLISTV